MVNWKDDAVVRVCARSFALCACAGFGMYIWEFVLALRFDLDHFTGRRPFKWTFIPYLLARYCILVALLGGVRISNAYGSDIDCVAWNQVVYGFAHITFVFASLLLLLRVLAVAQHDRKITIPLILFYLANVGGLVHGIVESDSVHRPDIDVCMAVNTHASLLNVTMSFAFDTTCLIVMIVVLWRTKAGGSLWHFLMSQGVMYFIVTAGSYLPPVIFLILDLNDPMNEIPQAFAVTIMAICATRMYRNLATFASRTPHTTTYTPSRSFHATAAWDTRASHTPQKLRPQASTGPEISIDVSIEHHRDTDTRDQDRESALADDIFTLRKMDSQPDPHQSPREYGSA